MVLINHVLILMLESFHVLLYVLLILMLMLMLKRLIVPTVIQYKADCAYNNQQYRSKNYAIKAQ